MSDVRGVYSFFVFSLSGDSAHSLKETSSNSKRRLTYKTDRVVLQRKRGMKKSRQYKKFNESGPENDRLKHENAYLMARVIVEESTLHEQS